jgi:hypothetical protein
MTPAVLQDAFGVVIFAFIGCCALIALITLFESDKLYKQIGRGGLSLNEDDQPPPPAPGGTAALRERDDEIRQLLTARNERRVRRGEAELDIEDELRRLTAPAVDPALREEVRQLVVARNERRARSGREPLDVDAEVERQLRELA